MTKTTLKFEEVFDHLVGPMGCFKTKYSAEWSLPLFHVDRDPGDETDAKDDNEARTVNPDSDDPGKG